MNPLKIVDFHNPAHFVLVWLMLPGMAEPQRNQYPDCHMRWHGDTLQIFPVGSYHPRASYHRSIVTLAEEHGEPNGGPRALPPENGHRSDPTAAENLRQVPQPAIPDATQILPKIPTEGENNDGQRRGDRRARGEESATAWRAQRPAARPEVMTRNDNQKQPTEAEVDREIVAQAGKLKPHTEDGLGFPEVWDGALPGDKPGKEPRNFQADSTLATPKDSKWSLLKQMVLSNRDDEPDIILGREQSLSGTSHRRTGHGTHRKSYYASLLNGPKRRWTRMSYRILSHRLVRGAALASVVYLSPAPVSQ